MVRNKRAVVYSCAWAVYAFATLVIAVYAHFLVVENHSSYIQPFLAWLPDSMPLSLVIVALFAALTAGGLYYFLTHLSSIHAFLERSVLRRPELNFSKRSIIKASVILFLFWLPILVISYPSGFTYDTHNQLYMFQTSAPTYYTSTGEIIDAELIDSHPLFTTLLYGVFWSIGNTLGSQNAGIFLFVVLQSVLLAAELGFVVCYLGRLQVPYLLRLAALAFFALFPLFGHYAATMLKDVSYVAVLLPWIVMWLEIARTRGKALHSAPFFITFFILGGCCILTKKLGVYVLAACLVVLVCVMKGQRVRLMVASALTLVLFYSLFPALVSPVVGGVAPGGRQESLAPAIQQTTALLMQHPETFTESELATINKVFDTAQAQRNYELFRADGAKNTFHSLATNAEVGAFLQVWAVKGLRYPLVYLYATAGTSAMQYIPFMKFSYYTDAYLPYRDDLFVSYNPDYAVNISQPAALVALNDYLEFNSVEAKISNLPGISLFFTQGFYGGWVPMFVLFIVLWARGCMKKQQPTGPLYVFALAPMLVIMLFFLISPVSSPRYVLPLLYAAPLFLGWAWYALSGTIMQAKKHESETEAE